ncbi:hypothetical protein [Rubritalea tangerina]|uniref:hypothetical protein n=1 Tax=Rubritalea tangerina TaxID=430798 RepID=UPI003622EAB8
MILSMFSVAMVRRVGLSANVAAALGWVVSAISYGVVAMHAQNQVLFWFAWWFRVYPTR